MAYDRGERVFQVPPRGHESSGGLTIAIAIGASRKFGSPVMRPSIGILAFGSLIDNPGPEIAAAIVGRRVNVPTPFRVEFARSSIKRAGAPTLVPVAKGGSPLLAQILVVSVPEQDAKDRLWRREIDKIGQGGHYVDHARPRSNTLIIDRYEHFAGMDVVLAARFSANITPLRATRLAQLAIESARCELTGRDGISYLIAAKRNGITTPLSASYEQEILHQTRSRDLDEALRKIRRETANRRLT